MTTINSKREELLIKNIDFKLFKKKKSICSLLNPGGLEFRSKRTLLSNRPPSKWKCPCPFPYDLTCDLT